MRRGAEDQGQWRAKFVGKIGEKLRLRKIERLQPFGTRPFDFRIVKQPLQFQLHLQGTNPFVRTFIVQFLFEFAVFDVVHKGEFHFTGCLVQIKKRFMNGALKADVSKLLPPL